MTERELFSRLDIRKRIDTSIVMVPGNELKKYLESLKQLPDLEDIEKEKIDETEKLMKGVDSNKRFLCPRRLFESKYGKVFHDKHKKIGRLYDDDNIIITESGTIEPYLGQLSSKKIWINKGIESLDKQERIDNILPDLNLIEDSLFHIGEICK